MAESCRLKSEAGEDGSVVVNASFTMRPDPNMDSIIGQTAHNLDEVNLENQKLTHFSASVVFLDQF